MSQTLFRLCETFAREASRGKSSAIAGTEPR
jgi:hypothetical protein